MVKRVVAALGMMLLAASAAQAGTVAPEAWRPGANPYAHALQAEARRQAFWRGRAGAHRAVQTAEVSARKERYWQSQQRSRFLCQAGGGCL